MSTRKKPKIAGKSAQINAALILAEGAVFFGRGIGKKGKTFGEICFNTAMSGYQEIMTDPSYCGQVINFTCPHIGNVGTNKEDWESEKVYARGLVLRTDITSPSNFRSQQHFNEWLAKNNVTGICGVDTRQITRLIRKKGAQNVAIVFANSIDEIDIDAVKKDLKKCPDMKGLELAAAVTCEKPYEWKEGVWESENNRSPLEGEQLRGLQQKASKRGGASGGNEMPPHDSPETSSGSSTPPPGGSGRYCVVAVDYGAKHNILRNLVSAGCKVTVVPAQTSAKEILSYNPDGIFLSNGPGDPAATGKYALPIIKELLDSGLPLFGICLGHQLLGLALGCKTEKMKQGHRGANHPVKDLATEKVMITSQNHGFVVSKDKMPKNVEITHISLFDQTVQGIRVKDRPVFSVQGHPEASPGPHDTTHLFEQFVGLMKTRSPLGGEQVRASAQHEARSVGGKAGQNTPRPLPPNGGAGVRHA